MFVYIFLQSYCGLHLLSVIHFYGVRHCSNALHVLAHLILTRTWRGYYLLSQMRNLRHQDLKQSAQAYNFREGDPGLKPGSLASGPGLETTVVSLHMVYCCFDCSFFLT